MYHDLKEVWKHLLQTGLKEDGWQWDWTTLGTLPSSKHKNSKIRARVIAKSSGIWAAQSLALVLGDVAKEMGGELQVHSSLEDGDDLKYKSSASSPVVELEGDSRTLLALERPFLNLAAYVSGVATQTLRLVQKVNQACPKNPPRITLTRKTLPYYRDISIHGVRVGGGFPHRVSLSGGVLIKENHIAAAGGISKAIQGTRKVAPHGLKIEIEVRSQKELKQALDAGAEGVLLDNFTPDQVRAAIQFMKKYSSPKQSYFVEVSGGLNESTICDYAIAGVDVLSVGSLTHSVQPIDLSFLVDG